MKNTIFTIYFILFNNLIYCQTVSYNYDSLNRIKQVIYPDSSYIAYTYDASGNRIHKTGVKSTIVKACPQSEVTFYAGSNDLTKDYQWQADTLNGFFNLNPDAIYSGTNSSVLTLTNPPTSWYGNKYRCIISDINGQAYSSVYTLKFEALWKGTADTAWENIANWNCAMLPDAFTDVIISATAPHYPQVNSNAYCRSISLQYKTSLVVTSDDKLNVKGNSP